MVTIPNKSVLVEKLLEEAHLQTTHVGASGLKIAKKGYEYWTPTLK